MDTNIKFSERVAVLATIDPASQAAGTVTTAWVSHSLYHSLCAVLGVGVMTATSTVDAKFQQATDNAGTGAKDVTGKAITQLLAAGGNNRQVIIEMRDSDMDTTNGFGFVRLSVTVAAAASLFQAALYGVNTRYLPASSFNQAGVAQVI